MNSRISTIDKIIILCLGRNAVYLRRTMFSLILRVVLRVRASSKKESLLKMIVGLGVLLQISGIKNQAKMRINENQILCRVITGKGKV